MATAFIVFVALLIVLFGNHGSALQQCEGIILSPQRSSCLDTLAGIENNASICKQITYSQARDSCIAGIAERMSNITMCSQVVSQQDMVGCVVSISNSTRNITDCALAGAPYDSTCAYSIAKEDGFTRVSDCEKIANATLSTECTYLYDYSKAAATKNASYCAALPNARNMSLLSAIFATNNINSSQAIQFSLVNATPQNYCYYNLALKTPNIGLCNFTSGYMNSLCKASFSTAIKGENLTNETVCNYAPKGAQSLCKYGVLSTLAISERNVSRCLQIINVTVPQYQYSCISSLAIRYNDSSYCNYISNSTVAQGCVMSVAYEKDISNTIV